MTRGMTVDQVANAIQAIQDGKCVGMPTETVYGLAAPINNEDLVKKIFYIKGRPSFDPLIVHVSDCQMAEELTSDWNRVCQILADAFWPGPLTLVIKKNESVSDIITSGLDTVGVRMPRHPLALELIRRLKVPVAAPSANKFGRTSPTSAQHVREEFSESDVFVIEGGASDIGIESTILKVETSKSGATLSLLRPGMILPSAIDAALTRQGISFRWERNQSSQIQSAGQLKHHYMPKVPLLLLKQETLAEAIGLFRQKLSELPSEVEGVKIKKPSSFNKARELILSEDAAIAARELYGKMRDVDAGDADFIFFRVQTIHQTEVWKPIMDRLNRASLWRSSAIFNISG